MTPAKNAQKPVSSETDETYTMSVDLGVLEPLGINLYSNAAAVLSELVANAYDADASLVSISWRENGDRILVTDDGRGMSVDDVNSRFLTVGYKKRVEEGLKSSKWSRPFMGRKGIGKLSVFSIADTVTIYSTKDGVSIGLAIRVPDLMTAITEHRLYHPQPCEVPGEFAMQGTTISLSELRQKRANLTAAALRKRLARRFDVLDQTPPEAGGFYIAINGKQVTYADRQELKKLEFIWEFGKKTLPDEVLPNGITRFVLPAASVVPGKNWRVKGWIGTARRPTDLTDDDESGSLKNIIVLARKRPIQEGIIEKLDFSRLFGNYVTGQIEADFLDLDGEFEDIATSDRQRLMEDDERVTALLAFLRTAFVKAADQWSEARPKKEAADALAKYPRLRDWVNARPGWQRQQAEKMIGSIVTLEFQSKHEAEDRAALLRSGVLAFERVGLRAASEALDDLSNVTAADLLPLLGAQDAYEAGLWVDILRSRVSAIAQFRNLTSTNEKEKVLQQHLFGHLWLLDPSWERATTDAHMEERLENLEPGIFGGSTKIRTKFGRMDIHYATSSGKHIIVELKRYNVQKDTVELFDQGLKYYNTLAALLSKQNEDNPEIEVVFVLGDHPKTAGQGRFDRKEYIESAFGPINGRYVLYDQLIENAQRQYEAYLDASDIAKKLDDLLGTIKAVP